VGVKRVHVPGHALRQILRKQVQNDAHSHAFVSHKGVVVPQEHHLQKKGQRFEKNGLVITSYCTVQYYLYLSARLLFSTFVPMVLLAHILYCKHTRNSRQVVRT